ncbi:HPF/RaiA family ribosome-associated protein [Kribbella sp. NPDC048928]|uniref:HPF/RaiA family ribosome-associated protein n=1 Tax=Kribbella sp. NPDC048928 TaxID=3364111 RepID=UPI0037137D74
MNEGAANVQVTVRGDVPEASAEYALAKVRHVMSRTPDRIGSVHAVLAVAANPAHEAPDGVEVEVQAERAPVHVHAAGAALTEAVDEAVDRLRRQLTDLRERPRARRRTPRPVPAAVEPEEKETDDHE